jgi:hypothetical protein
MTAKTYDPKCYDLAETFLSDSPEINNEQNRCDLAAHIQTEIESWIEYYEQIKAMLTGPSIGTYLDRDIPEWIEARGGLYTYNRIWSETEHGGELSQLAKNELMIAPGLIYKLKE